MAIYVDPPKKKDPHNKRPHDLHYKRPHFNKALGRFSIASIDETKKHITAQFNPKELAFNRTVNWSKTNNRDTVLTATGYREDSSSSHQYTGSEGRTLEVELLFDASEYDYSDANRVSVQPQIAMLESMACAEDAGHKKVESKRRPHEVVAVWGVHGQELHNGVSKLRGVITKLAVKYTLFSWEGVPLRATVNVGIQEAILNRKDLQKAFEEEMAKARREGRR